MKSGGTVFEVSDVNTGENEKYFFQSAVLNSMRREVLDALNSRRKQKPCFVFGRKINSFLYPFGKETGYQNNVSNHLARQFYRRHGLPDPGRAFELLADHDGLTVMTTKHCLKYQLGYCTKYEGSKPFALNEPLYLTDGINNLRLGFDCLNCQMRVVFKAGCEK